MVSFSFGLSAFRKKIDFDLSPFFRVVVCHDFFFDVIIGRFLRLQTVSMIPFPEKITK